MLVVAVLIRVAVGVLGPGLDVAMLVVPVALVVLVGLRHVQETRQRLPLILVVSFHDVLVSIEAFRQVVRFATVVRARLRHVRRLIALVTRVVVRDWLVVFTRQHSEMHVPGAWIVTETVQGLCGAMQGTIHRDRHIVLSARVDIPISI